MSIRPAPDAPTAVAPYAPTAVAAAAATWQMQINWRNVYGRQVGSATSAFCTLPSNFGPSAPQPTVDAIPMDNAIQKHNLLVIKCVADKCERVLKIRQPASDFKAEGTNLIRMYNTVGALMAPIRAFVRLTHFGKVWGGVLMDHYDTSINSIIFPKRASDLRKLSVAFEKERPDGSSGGHGIGLRYTAAGLQTAAIVACMELLQRMHSFGWVHGDTHLGNFLMDLKTWRVVVIDVERSFTSRDVAQHLMDIQELFGHATGLILSNTGGWDMLDIFGVSMRMHPELAAGARDNVMRMLPICSCFACDNPEDRLDGCGKCQSDFYDQAAAHYDANRQAYVSALSAYTLGRAASRIAVKRASVRAMIETVAGPLMLQLPSLPSDTYDRTTPVLVDEYNEWVSELIFSPDDAVFQRVVAALGRLNRPEADSVADLLTRSRI
jgi:hypothetical protein